VKVNSKSKVRHYLTPIPPFAGNITTIMIMSTRIITTMITIISTGILTITGKVRLTPTHPA
jgi:hypothetical protein